MKHFDKIFSLETHFSSFHTTLSSRTPSSPSLVITKKFTFILYILCIDYTLPYHNYVNYVVICGHDVRVYVTVCRLYRILTNEMSFIIIQCYHKLFVKCTHLSSIQSICHLSYIFRYCCQYNLFSLLLEYQT